MIHTNLVNCHQKKMTGTHSSSSINLLITSLVKKVVYKTYEELVLNSDKDVLLQLTVPFSEACVYFAPNFESTRYLSL